MHQPRIGRQNHVHACVRTSAFFHSATSACVCFKRNTSMTDSHDPEKAITEHRDGQAFKRHSISFPILSDENYHHQVPSHILTFLLNSCQTSVYARDYPNVFFAFTTMFSIVFRTFTVFQAVESILSATLSVILWANPCEGCWTVKIRTSYLLGYLFVIFPQALLNCGTCTPLPTA